MIFLPSIRHRLISGFSMAAVAVAACFFMPDWGVPFILAVLMALMIFEFYQMIAPAGLPSFRCFGTCWAVILVLVTWYTAIHIGMEVAVADALVLFGATILIFLRVFPQKNNSAPLHTISGTLFGLLYIGLLWNFTTKLLLFQRPADLPLTAVYLDGRLLILYGVLAAKFTDIGAYLVGCAIGKHKLIPRISPGKSWEGVFGGIAVGTLVGTAFVALLPQVFVPLGITWPRAIVLGIVLSICSITGDLTESLFKRAANVKDSSGFIPGMGGILDVFDSLLFTFPALYLYIWLIGLQQG